MGTTRKKILHVITKSVWGGAQRYVFDLATNLPRDQFDVSVVTGGNGPLVERLEQAGIRTKTLPILQERGGIFEALFSLVNLRALFALLSIYRKERPDVIHLNSSKIGGLGGLAAFFYKLLTFNFKYLNIVFTIHGWPFKEDRPPLARFLIFFLSWLSSLFQDKVILINKADYKIAKRFVPQRKLALVHNGIGEIAFFPRDTARAFLAKKIGHPITSNTLLVGTNAELTKNKGLTYLISAVCELSKSGLDLHTIIISGGEERKKLTGQIKSLGVENKIFLLGFVPDAARLLKGLDIFVLPSLKEGLPYSIMEAMSAGLPVVATEVGGIPDLVEDEKNGFLVPPKNIQALGGAIMRLARETNLSKKMGERNVEKIKTQFKLENMLIRTANLYRSSPGV